MTEFTRIYNTYRQDVYAKSRNNSRLYKPSGLKSPASVDWRDKNVVTRVKNQVPTESNPAKHVGRYDCSSCICLFRVSVDLVGHSLQLVLLRASMLSTLDN